MISTTRTFLTMIRRDASMIPIASATFHGSPSERPGVPLLSKSDTVAGKTTHGDIRFFQAKFILAINSPSISVELMSVGSESGGICCALSQKPHNRKTLVWHRLLRFSNISPIVSRIVYPSACASIVTLRDLHWRLMKWTLDRSLLWRFDTPRSKERLPIWRAPLR
jgi:hypothetical protein